TPKSGEFVSFDSLGSVSSLIIVEQISISKLLTAGNRPNFEFFEHWERIESECLEIAMEIFYSLSV
ncbi:hypothetical protein, partial [Leptospira ellisii]|uniref:hypothetical protein n=1 Tax=Leptospira ellisii TaxID=2023197 RepID=UPI001AA00B16